MEHQYLNRNTLAEQIYHILKRDILTQKIKCGEKLTLKTLQERFQVSSTPVREAVTRLIQDGLITYYSNSGVRVVSINNNDLKEIFSYIAELDGIAIRFSANHPNQEELKQELASNISRAALCLNQEKNPQDWISHSDRFHHIFYDYCQNSRLKSTADKARCQLMIFSFQYKVILENQLSIQKEHVGIYKAFINGNITSAVSLMNNHFINSYKLALKCL